MTKKQNIYSIHYSCSGFYNGGALAPSICCIAVYNIKTEEMHSFCLDNYIKKGYSLMESERLLLKDFVEFFNKIGNSFFIHWLMDGETYGFKAIFARCLNFGIDNLELNNFIDFNLASCSNFSLIDTLEENNCKKVTVLNGKNEAIGFNNQNFKIVALSTKAKAIGLAELFKKYTKGTWCCDIETAEQTEKLINTPMGIKLYKMLCDITNCQEKIHTIMQVLKTDEDREFIINAIDDGKTNINLLEFLTLEYVGSKKSS